MKQKVILFFLLLIAACGQNTGVTNVYEVYTGSEGLAINFLDNSPPEEVFENSAFNIAVELENKGAADIEDGTIVFTLERPYMDVDENNVKEKPQTFNLKGKDKFNPKGEKQIKTIFVETKSLTGTARELETNIIATACYKYQTILRADVCIDTDVYNTFERTDACNVEDYSSSGQGAPLVINEIETKMIPTSRQNEKEPFVRPQFRIFFENKGGGEILQAEDIAKACSSESFGRESLNRIKIKDIKLSNRFAKNDFNCLPEVLKIDEEDDFIVCTMKEEAALSPKELSYATGLAIDVEYGYTQSIGAKTVIKRISS